MSSTATTTEPLNDHASPTTSTGMNEVQHTKQGAVEAGRLRLDALTIAGLTGTPHQGHAAAAARFFGRAGGASASPLSPAGSDDTLGSIQDSSVGDEDKDGGGSSVLSDELGEIAFTDDEHDSSGSENGEGDYGGGDASLGGRDVGNTFTATVLGSGKALEEEACRNGGTSAGEPGTEGGLEQGEAADAEAGGGAAATRETEGDRSLGLAADFGAPPESRIAVPRPAATNSGGASAAASGVECSRGGAMSSAASGVDSAVPRSAEASSPLLPSRPAAQATPPGNEGQQHQRHRPRSADSPNTEEEQQQQQQHSRHSDNRVSDDRAAETGTVGISSSDNITTSTRLRGVSATTSTSAADASSCSTVGGADSGGGGISSPLQPVPPGTVPTVTCKVLVVGNAKCGKSSIISRFVNNRFSSDYRSTVGADYAMKDVCLQGGRQVRLQLWDIAGQDRFAKLTRAYFRRAKGAVVVCDVTREGTFDAIVRWKEEIDLWCQNEGCELPVYLFANKCDLLTEVQDSFLAGATMEKTCRDSGFAGWYITSAKRGDNINTAMTNLVDHALKAEDQRNRGVEGGTLADNGNGGANGDDGGGPRGEAFQLSSRGRREGEGKGSAGQQGACCAGI